MFRLISGIFANSLHGREFSFERLSACKCRSPRKSPPRDYVKKPFAVELGKSSPGRTRLLELMKQGCPCEKDTVKERWFSTNQHIILGLAKVLNRPANAVSDFLYLLTLQNFSKIMNPTFTPGYHCAEVPFAYPNACEDYMRLFDTHGNIRSRFSHDSLVLLMRVMQDWLKKGSQRNARPFSPCFANARSTFRRENKARRAGIDRDSIARRNGRRRLVESDERASLTRRSLIGIPASGWTNSFYGSASQRRPLQGKPTRGDPGYVFGRHFLPEDLHDCNQDRPCRLGEPACYEEEMAAERARRLEALLFQLNARTYLTREAFQLVEAIKGIEVRKPRQKSARKFDTDSTGAKSLSDGYYQVLGESASRFRLKTNELQDQDWKDSSQDRPRKHRSHRHRSHKPTEDQVGKYSGFTDRLYDGAPIPVLMHEPYDQDKPWTWLRRHPHQMRMDDRGSLVEDKNIRRYRRATVNMQMKKAREQDSVHSIYTNANAPDAPMFGNLWDQKKANRKSLSRSSLPRQSIARQSVARQSVAKQSVARQSVARQSLAPANSGINRHSFVL